MPFALAGLLSAFRRPVAPAPVVRATMPVAPRAAIAPGKGKNRIAAALIAGTVGSGVCGLAVTKIGTHEGYSEKAIIPVKGDVPTICFGETRGIRMGMTRTRPQCEAMFLEALSTFADGIERCVTKPMSDNTYVAFLSLSYNIGIGSKAHPGFCQSSVVRQFNAGNGRAACDAMLAFNKGGKPRRVLAGLVRRRQEERAMCLKGI